MAVILHDYPLILLAIYVRPRYRSSTSFKFIIHQPSYSLTHYDLKTHINKKTITQKIHRSVPYLNGLTHNDNITGIC
jgi:hypothetical protein